MKNVWRDVFSLKRIGCYMKVIYSCEHSYVGGSLAAGRATHARFWVRCQIETPWPSRLGFEHGRDILVNSQLSWNSSSLEALTWKKCQCAIEEEEGNCEHKELHRFCVGKRMWIEWVRELWMQYCKGHTHNMLKIISHRCALLTQSHHLASCSSTFTLFLTVFNFSVDLMSDLLPIFQNVLSWQCVEKLLV
jgi:hypothetical protein